MPKALEGITLFDDSTQITGKNKKNGSSPSLNIVQNDSASSINFSNTPESPLGGSDFLSMEVPFPINLIPVVPSKIPKMPPLTEYLPVLGVMKKALAISIASTAVKAAADQINKKVTE